MTPNPFHIEPPSTPAWPGPDRAGLTQSIINEWLQCPFRSYLTLICGLQDDAEPHKNLIWGDSGHKGLEYLLSGTSLTEAKDKAIEYMYNEYSSYLHIIEDFWEYSIRNMLEFYLQTLPQPGLPATTPNLTLNIEWKTEESICIPYTLPSGRSIHFRGKVDGIHKPSNTILEHKFKGKVEEETMWAEIPFDFQINLYAYATGTTHVYYDIIRIPDVQFSLPYRNVGMSPKEYADSLYFGPCKASTRFPVANHRDQWIFQKDIPLEYIDFVLKFQFEPIAQRIVEWYDLVTSPSFDPNNPAHYGPAFYIAPVRQFNPSNTGLYKCKFHSFLTGTQYIHELLPIDNFYPELP